MVCSPTLVPEQGADRVGIGSLIRSLDDRGMLSMEDQVVLGLETGQTPKVGDRLTAARVGRSLMDPQRGQSAGRVLYALGILEVTEVRDRVARARVAYSCAPIALGDRVLPYTAVAFPEERLPKPTGRTVAGSVLDSLRGEQHMGQQQMAFVDVGTSQGIEIGDVFALLRPNRPALSATGLAYPIPPDRLGDAVVVRVAERAATLLLTTSVREVRAGDRVVLSHQIAP
jgi:hypothetical protein